MAGRNLMSAVGILCVILAALVAGMVPAIANYRSAIGKKDEENASLNQLNANLYSQFMQSLTDLEGNKTLLSQTKTWLNNNVTSNNALQRIVNLQELTLLYGNRVAAPRSQGYLVWHNVPSIAPELWGNLEGQQIPIAYAGYLVVVCVVSLSPNTYVQVEYSYQQFHYNNTVKIGTTGVAYFPILPTKDLIVNLLNTDLTDLYALMVTVTYYY